MLIVLLLLLLASQYALRMPGPRRALDRAMLKAPLFGPLLRERITAQLDARPRHPAVGRPRPAEALAVARDMLSQQRGAASGSTK